MNSSLLPQTTGLDHVSPRWTTRCVRASSVVSSAPKPSAAQPLAERGATPASSAPPSRTHADEASSPTSAREPAKVGLSRFSVHAPGHAIKHTYTATINTVTITLSVIIWAAFPTHDILRLVLTSQRGVYMYTVVRIQACISCKCPLQQRLYHYMSICCQSTQHV